MALYTYRQMPPTGPDNIAPGRSPGRLGSILSSGYHRRGPMKTIHFESAAHYHRLGFDARLKLKRIDTRMDTLIYPAVYKYIYIYILLLSLYFYRTFFFSPSFFFSHQRYAHGGYTQYVPTCIPLNYVTHTRERLPYCNLYD